MKKLRDIAPFEAELDTEISVRLRPVNSSDRWRAHEAYSRLSELAKLNRFWTKQRSLSAKLAKRLTDTDESDHVGWIALPLDSSADIPGYGAASFWRDTPCSDRAEFSVTILDEWQRKRFGSLLLSILWFEAWHEGIREFHGVARRENEAMRNWWLGAGGKVVTSERQHELSLPLEDPVRFANRVEFDVHATPIESDLAIWFRKWADSTAE